MSQIFMKEIPNRMLNKITYVNFFMPNKNDHKVLALTSDYHLYELKRKEIIFDCDLSGSVIKDSHLPLYPLDPPDNRSDSNTSQRSDLELENVQFGKFYSYTGSGKRLFLLVRAFDKLVIVERTSGGFQLVKEFINVDRFEISDSENSYRACIAIYFQGQLSPIFEDLVENTSNDTAVSIGNDESFRMINDRIAKVRSELAAQEATTRREFELLKDRLMFGPNQVRSDRKEEKQPLGKYGDIWKKICGEVLVIGIPVINNCSRRLTVLHNLRGVIVCPDKDDIEFEYDLYQLNDDSYEFENWEVLLSSKEKSINNDMSFSKEWYPVKNKVLRPETCGVLVLQTQLKSILNSNVSNLICHCFILYDIISGEKTTTQQYYVKSIEIDTNILCCPEYQITFELSTIYKDLLAISATSKLFAWEIEHKSDSFVEKLSEFFIRTFGFTRIIRKEETPENMEVDIDEQLCQFMRYDDILDKATSSRAESKKGPNEIFYHIPTGYNHLMGTLIRFESIPEKLQLKIYVRDEYKAFFIVDKLYKEFEEECDIMPKNNNHDCQKASLQNLEEGLRKEIEIAMENVKACEKERNFSRSNLFEKQARLYAQELQTDMIYMNIT